MANENEDSPRSVSRRTVLKIVAGSAGAAVNLPILKGAAIACQAHVAGPAQAAAASVTFTPKFFSTGQLQTLAVVAEIIIPADDHSPGAREARVHEYIDTIIAESPAETRKVWTDGLAALDAMASERHGRGFADCSPDQQVALIEKIARNEENPETLEEKFFLAAKRATIDGYYTSEIGIHQDLQYQGNTALLEFPGCTHQAHGKQ